MGFNMLFYIIFGTNLLTRGPVPVSVFLPILVFSRKGIPNRVQAEWNLHDDLSWTESKPEDLELKSGMQWGDHEAGGHAQGGRRTPTLMGPTDLLRRTSFANIYTYTLETSGRATKALFHRRNLLYPWDPILGPFPAICRRGESIIEGIYINTIASPMKHE